MFNRLLCIKHINSNRETFLTKTKILLQSCTGYLVTKIEH